MLVPLAWFMAFLFFLCDVSLGACKGHTRNGASCTCPLLLILMLPKVLAGERITRKDLAEMAHGGLCPRCEKCNYALCSFPHWREIEQKHKVNTKAQNHPRN